MFPVCGGVTDLERKQSASPNYKLVEEPSQSHPVEFSTAVSMLQEAASDGEIFVQIH